MHGVHGRDLLKLPAPWWPEGLSKLTLTARRRLSVWRSVPPEPAAGVGDHVDAPFPSRPAAEYWKRNEHLLQHG